MLDIGLLIIRLVVGLLVAGHGAQKLFGWFEGPRLEGASGMMESLGYRPGRPWALMAGLSEFLGGLLFALGLLNPLGSLGIMAVMATAIGRAHWGRPIWVTSGGGEFPLTNFVVAVGIGLAGPGYYSLDQLWDASLPAIWAWIAFVVVAVVTGAGIAASSQMAKQPQPAAKPRGQAEPVRGPERVSEPVSAREEEARTDITES